MTVAAHDVYEPEPTECIRCGRWKVRSFGPYTTDPKYHGLVEPEATTITYCEGCGAVRAIHEVVE